MTVINDLVNFGVSILKNMQNIILFFLVILIHQYEMNSTVKREMEKSERNVFIRCSSYLLEQYEKKMEWNILYAIVFVIGYSTRFVNGNTLTLYSVGGGGLNPPHWPSDPKWVL
jgi:hypothetical protein